METQSGERSACGPLVGYGRTPTRMDDDEHRKRLSEWTNSEWYRTFLANRVVQPKPRKTFKYGNESEGYAFTIKTVEHSNVSWIVPVSELTSAAWG
uniref:Inhibitor_I29 domain-containing protein n=1 Tax=Steinernema glaseri TaxID=37863 RepID=A0A1I8AR87_9BILA